MYIRLFNNFLLCAILLMPCWLSGKLTAQSFSPGQTYFGANSYVEYRAGNLPIIISAPHGGDKTPAAIPDRACPDAVTLNDANTQALSRQLDTAIQMRFGCYPHLIINRLARRKLDANHDLPEAACGNPLAEQAWYDYHEFIDSAKNAVVATYGRGIFIDLHGHAHTIQRLELGYLLSGAELRKPDDSLNLPAYVQESSIRRLAENNLHQYKHAQLLRDSFALGTLLQAAGYPSVPSAADPAPLAGEPYFNGGYNTYRHGSSQGGAIEAVQIECYYAGVRDTWANRRQFADTLALAVQVFLEKHLFDHAFIPDISGGETVCEDGIYTYSVPALPGNSYLWMASGGEILSGQGSASVQVRWLTPGNGSITVMRLCP
ncbi:MAG TPA: hypothetical protein PKL15_12155 [Saprospiraceae bacterium]|nr:hypothetical protein [Saprospiraceae bacterium]